MKKLIYLAIVLPFLALATLVIAADNHRVDAPGAQVETMRSKDDGTGVKTIIVNTDPDNAWISAGATGGIVNTTTAVTLKAAAGVGKRNFINSLQISTDTLGGATEIVVRDGAAGTVVWRQKLQTGPLPLTNVLLARPIPGTANTLMEVALLTAVTGGVFVSAQGYSAP
jgi:hypothetical protein